MVYVSFIIPSIAILLMLNCHKARYILLQVDETETWNIEETNATNVVGARSK